MVDLVMDNEQGLSLKNILSFSQNQKFMVFFFIHRLGVIECWEKTKYLFI